MTTQAGNLSPCEELYRYLRLIGGDAPGRRLIEVRYAIDGGMAQRFTPARQLGRAHQLIRTLAPKTDAYAGVLLRDRRAGGRDAVTSTHLAFVEIDATDGHARLARFRHQPTLVIASGTPGHLHAYWQLGEPIGPLELEQANRRLAHHLGGDSASVDAARILRPPATLNHKHTPPVPVQLVDDPDGRPARGPAHHRRDRRHPLDKALLAIPAPDYIAALTAQQPNRAGKVRCPFHDLSVGRADGADVSPARSSADASSRDRGGPR